MLCIGSSLEVFPAAGLPELTLEAGGRIAIMTRSATPYDDAAAVRLDGDLAVSCRRSSTRWALERLRAPESLRGHLKEH